jgi:hypothetical protein
LGPERTRQGMPDQYGMVTPETANAGVQGPGYTVDRYMALHLSTLPGAELKGCRSAARNSAQVHNCWRANCLRSPRDVEIVRTCESDQPTDRVITLPQSALFSPRGLNRRLLRRATIKKALKPVLHLKAVLLALVTTIAAVALRYHPRHVLRADRTRMVYVRKPIKETCP